MPWTRSHAQDTWTIVIDHDLPKMPIQPKIFNQWSATPGFHTSACSEQLDRRVVLASKLRTLVSNLNKRDMKQATEELEFRVPSLPTWILAS